MKAIRTIPPPALLLVLACLPACVVPVGPKWSDPQSNYPPTLHSATPPVGSILGFDPDGGTALVQVVLADQNTKDKLYTRFIIDYPPFAEGASHIFWQTILPGGNQIDRPAITFAPNCSDDQIARGFTNHRLLLAASDQPFASDDPVQSAPDAVPNGNFLVEATWSFDLDCQ